MLVMEMGWTREKSGVRRGAADLGEPRAGEKAGGGQDDGRLGGSRGSGIQRRSAVGLSVRRGRDESSSLLRSKRNTAVSMCGCTTAQRECFIDVLSWVPNLESANGNTAVDMSGGGVVCLRATTRSHGQIGAPAKRERTAEDVAQSRSSRQTDCRRCHCAKLSPSNTLRRSVGSCHAPLHLSPSARSSLRAPTEHLLVRTVGRPSTRTRGQRDVTRVTLSRSPNSGAYYFRLPSIFGVRVFLCAMKLFHAGLYF